MSLTQTLANRKPPRQGRGGHPQRRSDSPGQPVTTRSSADRSQSADGSVLGRRKFRAGGQGGGGGGGGVGRAPSSLAASPTFRLPRTVNQNRGKPRSGLQAAATTSSTSSTAAARAHHKHVPGSSRGRLALVAATAAAAQAGPARAGGGEERESASQPRASQPALARSPSFLPASLSLPPRLPNRQKAPLAAGSSTP